MYCGGHIGKNSCWTVKGKVGKWPTLLLQTLKEETFLLAASLTSFSSSLPSQHKFSWSPMITEFRRNESIFYLQLSQFPVKHVHENLFVTLHMKKSLQFILLRHAPHDNLYVVRKCQVFRQEVKNWKIYHASTLIWKSQMGRQESAEAWAESKRTNRHADKYIYTGVILWAGLV